MPRAHSVRVQLPNEVRDCALHPSTDLLFSGTLQGQLYCHRLVQPADVLESLDVQIGYAGPGCDSCFIQAEEVWEQEVDNGERGACRSLALSQDGSTAAVGTASTEILLVDTQAGKEKGSIADEAIFEPSNVQEDPEQHHETSLHRLSYMGQHLVSGHGDGSVRLWDVRTPNRASITFEEQDSEVNDLCCSAAKHRMLVVAGGTLAVYDMRKKGTLRALSDEDEDEKLAVALCKAGKKVAVGTQMGVLSLFSWGHFEDCSDRFRGHPDAVDALCLFDEDTLITGSSDGGVRVVSILPNQLLSFLGPHARDDSGVDDLPVERLALSGDKRLLASVAHDDCVQIWDLKQLHDDSSSSGDDDKDDGAGVDDDDAQTGGDERDASGGEDDEPPRKKRAARSAGKAYKSSAEDNFFEGLL